jgi:sulfofructose kinase
MSDPGLDVVGLGYCSLDYLGIVPERPDFDTDTLSLGDFCVDGGGPVSTALVAATRLGLRTGYLGVFGDDEAGARLKIMFEAEGVDVSQLRIAPGCRSQVCMVLVESGTGRRSILCHRPTYPPLLLDDADRACVQTARALHLDAHHMGAAIRAAGWAREKGIPVFLDANRPRPGLDELIPLVDYLVTSATFASAYTGDPDRLSAQLALLALGPRAVVSTQGPDGCSWVSRDGGGRAPGFAVRAVDTTGAGDSFHGAFVFGVLAGWGLPRVARFANAVAALNCRKLGGRVGLPTLEETLSFMRSNERGT